MHLVVGKISDLKNIVDRVKRCRDIFYISSAERTFIYYGKILDIKRTAARVKKIKGNTSDSISNFRFEDGFSIVKFCDRFCKK